MSEFSEKIVVVTGGASGIGAAAARSFSDCGARVALIDQNAAAVAELAEEIGGYAYALDIVDEQAVKQAINAIERDLGSVEVLVASAGIVQDPLPPDQLPLEVFDRLIEVDFRGLYLCCTEVGTRMAARGKGAIVAISSVAGMRSMPLHAYSPAKAAVISLVECLAAEWGRSGVRVNTVSPGYTLTPALKEQIARGYREPAQLREMSATGELIYPEDIAEAIQFLASERASCITGVNVPVDGGWLVSGSWQTFGGVRASRKEVASD
ncbi:SDR family NAD(P)-dependent oxidoreductase [Marinobacter sp. 2_MG-2023]|uniref:SDR family NAD(P)-dependent oxidoreductase n=1 Tax=Marinobacter sp. 2_MG-2023 TaxID=3062679 RepID=UPI0026E15A86|nr:SDR family oxidoreductase [Marinobacter sp. 2_MG-2023]MDO6441435.1 SDR family oxidoreductase [Marinobacter sp. 2_MG-2023]